MQKISVIAEFKVDEKDLDSFYGQLCGHAATSLAEDEGCERFDVMRPRKSAGRVLIYEIWTSKQALNTHAESEHTAQYRDATAHMVKARELTLCELAEGGVRADVPQ